MKERWRSIPGTDGQYFVSDWGRVWSQGRKPGAHGGGRYGGKILKTHPHKKGDYPMVSIKIHGVQRNITVHSIVAAAFIGPRPPGHHVRHGRLGPTVAHIDNLSYGTPLENAADKRCCPNCGWKW